MYLSTAFPAVLVVAVPAALLFCVLVVFPVSVFVRRIRTSRRELEQRVDELEDEVARLETRLEDDRGD
ncbi:hypothetical protein C440_14249 [Haloferax mucosum ATCC BAA-1512]|uniref:Uncharacterized protein n=1 Tax=Haloferax mucosum ATCC BAA-1512 TaxID=662479 RepID=M0I687_9EURY|nr:hypothetical protein [Haloferax mucosum]ELZ91482.1 hypothetical protein C440_14249 [Haloferax mucosum ATCC BAA-1512]